MAEKLSQKSKVNSLQDNDIFPISRDNGDSTYSSYGIEASDMQSYFGNNGNGEGNGGEPFTTWVLKERKEITSDTDTVEFTGLDGDSYNNIKILGKVKVVKDNTELYIQINDDTTATNYRRRLTYNGNDLTDQNYPGIEVGTSDSNDLAPFSIDLQTKSGSYRTALSHSATYISGSEVKENLTSAHVWYNENDNITKLALKGSESTAIGAGSIIELWVEKEVTMPTAADTPVELENGEYVCDGTEDSITIDVSEFEGENLIVKYDMRCDANAAAESVYLRFNNDSSNIYNSVLGGFIANNGTDNSSADGANKNYIYAFAIPANNAIDSNNFGSGTLKINNFKATDKYKSTQVLAACFAGDSDDTCYVDITAGLWKNTSKINTLTLYTNTGSKFIAGSKIKIYTEKIKGQAVGGSGETFTTWVLKERKEITVDTDTVEFAGLDGNSDEVYKLVNKIISGNTGSSVYNDIQLFINGDETASNYDNQRLVGKGTNASGDEVSGGHYIGATYNSNEITAGESIIFAKSDTYRQLQSRYMRNNGNAADETTYISTLWKNSSDNITSLKIKGATNGIGVGSVIELWVQKEVTMPTAADTPVELENGEYVCDGTEDSITIDVSEFEGEDLKLLTTLKTDRSGNTWDRVKIQFNNDTGNNYDCVWNESNALQTSINDIEEDGSDKDGVIITVSATDVDSEIFTNSTIFINKFLDSNFYKNLQGISFNLTNHVYCAFFGGIWKNTAPITTITFKPYYGSKFIAGSRIKVCSEKIKGQAAGGSGSSSTTENIGFTEIKTDRDFEVSAGQWKPIYMKKIDIGPMPDAGVTYIAHNISDLEYVISIKGHTLRSSDGLRSPLPYVPTDITYAARIDVTNTDIRIGLNTDWSAHDNAWVILEYTKNSDTATSQPRNT